MAHEPGVVEEGVGSDSGFAPLVSVDLRVLPKGAEAKAPPARLIARIQPVEALLVLSGRLLEEGEVLLEQNAQIVEAATEHGEIAHGLR